MKNSPNTLESYSQVFLSLTGDGASAGIYRGRRERLLRKMDSWGVIAGVPREPGSEELFFSTWCRLIQDPAFLFLTGINQPGCFLTLNPFASKQEEREILWLPKKNRNQEFWTGLRLGYDPDSLEEIRKITGFQTIKLSDDLEEELKNLFSSPVPVSHYYCFYFESHEDHHLVFANKLRTLAGNREMKSLVPLHFEERLILNELRIKHARTAQEWTQQAFLKILPQVRHFKNERLLWLELDHLMLAQSDGDLAFPTIVAGGKNACCLHYVKKDEALREGELVLLDFGVRCKTLHSDISRTLPVSGKFNLLQKMIYEIVLRAMDLVQSLAAPGVKIQELNDKVWKYIESELDEKIKSRGGRYRLCYDLKPHGVSHLIGEQVHEGDPKRAYAEEGLKAGMLISNEPGVYGFFETEIDGNRFEEWVGIRVEDDLLITENGCENLSASIPKTIAEIERLMKESV
ncbi:MAG: aminopeptidase P N-terminal domain-containing protein [Fibrobacter sp.]|jgi:Xaa-Pro aminopeptidase|nr:aminopeptidase P N-terminal domain-containing protein [Fibrobacter sp.]